MNELAGQSGSLLHGGDSRSRSTGLGVGAVHGHSRETVGRLGEEPGEAREPESVQP